MDNLIQFASADTPLPVAGTPARRRIIIGNAVPIPGTNDFYVNGSDTWSLPDKTVVPAGFIKFGPGVSFAIRAKKPNPEFPNRKSTHYISYELPEGVEMPKGVARPTAAE